MTRPSASKSAAVRAEEVVFNAAILADDKGKYEDAKNLRKLADELLREDRKRKAMERAIVAWVYGKPYCAGKLGQIARRIAARSAKERR